MLRQKGQIKKKKKKDDGPFQSVIYDTALQGRGPAHKILFKIHFLHDNMVELAILLLILTTSRFSAL